MAGVGAAIRAIKGMLESRKLDSQKGDMGQMADGDVLSLVPESYRPCAELRLLNAEHGIAAPDEQARLAADITKMFEQIRKAGWEMMVEQASRELVTRYEMIRLLNTLNDYARASRSDIVEVEEKLVGTIAPLQQKTAAHDESLADLERRTQASECSLAALQHVPRRVDTCEASVRTGADKIQAEAKTLRASMCVLRRWLIAVGIVSVIEIGAVIYLLTR